MSDGARHNVDYLIIGGGIAGTTAAEAIRSKDERGAIAILSKEPYELYSRVLLPKYVEGALSREQVFLRTAEDYNRQNISLFSSEEATVLDTKRKEVRTRRGAVFFYKQLLIAAGGRVKPWRVEGSENVPVTRFHTIADAEALRAKVMEGQAPKVVIIGGGFIALELLNAIVPRGATDIHLLLPEKRFWEDYIGFEGSALIEQRLERSGIFLHHHEAVTSTRLHEDGTIAIFTSRQISYPADILAVGIGLDRELEPFSGGGIEVKRGILTNEFLETAVADVWAAGDIAEFFHPVYGKPLLIGNWNNAFLQGRIAGLNMAAMQMKSGEQKAFTYIPLYAIDVLGVHIAFLGDVSASREHTNRTFVSRFSSEGGSASGGEEGAWYEQFGMQDGKLVSAVFINKFEDKRIIERLIAEQRDCAPFIPYLSDASVALADHISL